MSGKVGQRKRLVRVTEANLRNGHLYLTGNLGFLPADCFGASSKKGPLGKPLTLEVKGLPEPILTDVPTEASTGRPRRFFRERSWVAKFFKAAKVKPGDYISLEKVDRFRIRIGQAKSNG